MNVKQNRLLCLFLALIAVVTAFIFSQSLRGPEESNATSGAIVEIVEPFLKDLTGDDDLNVNFLVRKAGHLTEFCALGMVVMASVHQLRKKNNAWLGFAFFYVLAVGVTDEFIQSFTGRSDMVSDVLIDFTGAMIGFALVAAILWLRTKKGRKQA